MSNLPPGFVLDNPAPQGGPVLGPPPKAPAPARPPSAYEINRDNTGDNRNKQKDNFDQVTHLRGKFDGLQPVQSYRVAMPQYAQALQTAPTPEGDLALTYAFAKAMDPDSVVREGEQAAVANADNLAGRLAASLQNELLREGAFTPQKRAALRREMHVKIAELQRSYAAQRGRFEQDARAFGLDPRNVMGEHDGRPFRDIIRDYWRKNNPNSLPPAARGGDNRAAPTARQQAPARNRPSVSNW